MIFGIDGGGTRSRLKILSSSTGETLCVINGSSTNIYALDYEQVEYNIKQLLLKGCEKAGIEFSMLRSGCIGSAGLDRTYDKIKFNEMFRRFLPEHCELTLCNDGEILLVGASDSLEGYCIIAGTGSFAIGRNIIGDTVRAGGLGHLLGDEGSAFWISNQALVRSLRSAEGRDLNTRLLEALQEYFKQASPYDFISLVHRHYDKATFASFSPIVTKLALDGDELALDILNRAVQELVLLVESVHKRLMLKVSSLVISGGVLENDAIIRPGFMRLLEEKLPNIHFIKASGSPVDGACIIALQKLVTRHTGKMV